MARRNIDDPKYTRTCAYPPCGTEFQQRRPQQTTCSVGCRNRLVAQVRANSGGLRAKAGLEPRVCANPECGKTFQPTRGKQAACSLECYRRTPARQQAQQAHDANRDRAEYYAEYGKRDEVRDRKNDARRGSERVRDYNRKVPQL